jgi:hypothetical protein
MSKQNIVKQLGPTVEVNVKLKLPSAIVDYIATKEKRTLGKYCNEMLLQIMISHLDEEEDIVLRNYTIPRCLAYLNDEILAHYLCQSVSQNR